MSGEASSGAPERPIDRVVIEYIKSQYFRVIHVDGAIGGPTPSGQIHLAMFSQRPAIPRRLVALVNEGRIGEPIPEETVVREGMIREMDVDVMMSLSAAEEIGNLLRRIVSDTKEAIERNKISGEK